MGRYFGIYLIAMSMVTFSLYARDKKKAKKGNWRTPEKTLLGFSFLGGAVGGILAMQTLRHKTKHWYFHVVNILGLLWQVALLVYLFVEGV